MDISKHRVWISEATEVIKMLRDRADKAVTPDELKGYNAAIDIVKKLLLLVPVAKAKINRIKYEAELQRQNDEANKS